MNPEQKFISIVNDYCKVYLEEGYIGSSYYMFFACGWLICGLISKFWNPHIKFTLIKFEFQNEYVSYIINKLGLDHWYFDFRPMTFIQQIIVLLIMTRIFVFYYITL